MSPGLLVVVWIAGITALAYVGSKPQDAPLGNRTVFVWLMVLWTFGPPLAAAGLAVAALF